jgi:cytochrome c biogenesis protein CcdA/thiol-disulfide isomerase/thioredoxin
MTVFVLAYVAGLMTIASPCIFPILPFVMARAETPFGRGGLPMLSGLALTFAAVAGLAAVAGGWAVQVNQTGRVIALVVMTLFGLTLLFPTLASRAMAPVVAIGLSLSDLADRQAGTRATFGTSLLLGVAMGLVWAPCAGPVLGVILTGAALSGPGVETSLLLLAYGLGAATSLAAGLLIGRRLMTSSNSSMRWSEGFRRLVGAAVVGGVAMIWLGADTGLLTRLSSASTNRLEGRLVSAFNVTPVAKVERVGGPVAADVLPAPLEALFGKQPWLNGQLAPHDLRGKVVLVNFWTYSCINCLRTLPYTRAWAAKYGKAGLVVIGVHTPEFAFEKDLGNVRKGVSALDVSYLIVVDNDFAIWQAFGNQAWPAFYFIGADGRVRHQAFGEGNYDESERLIQQLLGEANGTTVTADGSALHAEGAQAAPDDGNLRSGETYLGYRQSHNFLSPGGIWQDSRTLYRANSSLPLNYWSLAGDWTVGSEFATVNETAAKVAYRFHARDVHLVMGTSDDAHPVRFLVTIDGAPPGADHGFDVDADGWGSVSDERLYQLVRQTGPVGEHTFEIQFFGEGVRAYAFTFG